MSFAEILLIVVAAAGHLALWNSICDHIQATGWPRHLVRWIGVGGRIVMLGAPVVAAAAVVFGGPSWWSAVGWRPAWGPFQPAILGYSLLCVAIACGPLVAWFIARLTDRPPAELASEQTRILDSESELGKSPLERGPRWYWCAVPKNEALSLAVSEKELTIPRLAEPLDGLSIAHLSDLHFTGAIGKDYFHWLVDLANDFEPDLTVLTGDLVDKTPCIDWVVEILGRLRARHGVYFVLGNHDRRVDVKRLLAELRSAGLIHMGGRVRELAVDGGSLLLAGDERPWFDSGTGLRGLSPPDDPATLRVLLAHTPDRLAWAKRQNFDLVLAGHTHGGQIRLPLVGPIVAPSHHGVKYASGTFHEPPTVMHVSRGISGLTPLRFNCPPELARLTLRCPKPRREQTRELESATS